MTQAAISILVTCDCGKKAFVAERFSGRKIRCKQCKTVLRVPALEPVPAPDWREPDGQAWSVQESAHDEVVLTPLATESTDELMLLPEVTRPSLWNDEVCRLGMRRSPADVRRLERGYRASERTRVDAPAPSRKRRSSGGWQVRHEAHVRAIAIWQGLGTAFGLIAVMLATLAFAQSLGAGAALGSAAIGGTLCVGFGLLTVGLWRMRNWARWILVALTGLSLLTGVVTLIQAPSVAEAVGLVISKAWDVAVLWVLLCPTGAQIFSQQYQSRDARRKPTVAWWWSPFFWIPLALMLLSLLGALILIAMAVSSAL